MWRIRFITIVLCFLNFNVNNAEVESTVLENIHKRSLLTNEKYGSQYEQDEISGFSGSGNESDGSGFEQDQLSVPFNIKDITEKYPGTKTQFEGKKVEVINEDNLIKSDQDQVNQPDTDLFMESSGDGHQEKSSTDQTERVHVLGVGPVNELVPSDLDLPCDQRKCSSTDKEREINIVATGGSTIPSAVEMILYCTVYSRVSDTVTLTWDVTIWDEFDRVKQSIKETVTKDQKTTTSVFRLSNVTEEDSGIYRCHATYHTDPCCSQNATSTIKVYTPPSISTDIAIVLVVCFFELILIIYFKSRSENKCESKSTERPSHKYRQLQIVQSKT
ncbi:hypothetical protein CHUAL_003408 [Chamberlinius hualienensis]